MKKSSSHPFLRLSTRIHPLGLMLAGMFLMGSPSAQADITWGPATSIAGDTDVSNVGAAKYAYGVSTAAVTINGVTFATIVSAANWGGSNVTTDFPSITKNTADPAGLSADYADLLDGFVYNAGATTATVTLGNLNLNHVYATQVWANDSRLRTQTVTLTSGANTVVLDINTTDANTGKGQYTIGGFTASGTTQTFTATASAVNTEITAAQVRDVTGVWSGAASGTWDDASANFTGGNSWTTASGLINTVYFSDTDGFKNAIANNTVSIQNAGVSTGTIIFQNNNVNYTINNVSGATGITGSTAISKTGTGLVTFTGTNTYTGATTISAGTLRLGIATTNLTSVTVAANAMLDLGGTVCPIINLDGSGTVSNGTFSVTGRLSPAGTNATGTLTVYAPTTLSGTLVADCTAAGTSDKVVVQGSLNLTSAMLEIVDKAALVRTNVYTLVTCSGTRTGTFTATNLAGTSWDLRYTTDGKVQLYYKFGTMVSFM